jgi:polysaccharide export outer membrane protein
MPMNKTSLIHDSLHPHRVVRRITHLIAGLILAASMFYTGCASNETLVPAKDQIHSEMIILREGDSLKITFPGSPNLDSTQQIRRDGKITMPLIGEVNASGMTPDQLRTNLVDLYSSQIASKEINVFVQSSSFPVFVNGAVVHPGKILSDHPITVLEAIMEAGGPDFSTANLHSVKVIRNVNGVMKSTTINVQDILDGKPVKPFYLEPEDIVYVKERFEWY